ncbi:MAG: RyR domain-containing protein [Acidimicrobiales bacterium]
MQDTDDMDDAVPPTASTDAADPSSSDARSSSARADDGGLGAEVLDAIARAIHRRYVTAACGEHLPADEDLSLRPWDQLPATLRRSNLDQAADIVDKLHRLGCDVVPAAPGETGEDEAAFAFTAAELELLAEVEHQRWVLERRAQGWVAGEVRDVAARRSPHLVSWSALPDDVRELDRNAVRAIPALLVEVGLRIVRDG